MESDAPLPKYKRTKLQFLRPNEYIKARRAGGRKCKFTGSIYSGKMRSPCFGRGPRAALATPAESSSFMRYVSSCRSLRCSRTTLHINLFVSFAVNNALWLIWYQFIMEPEVVHENRVSQPGIIPRMRLARSVSEKKNSSLPPP